MKSKSQKLAKKLPLENLFSIKIKSLETCLKYWTFDLIMRSLSKKQNSTKEILPTHICLNSGSNHHNNGHIQPRNTSGIRVRI